jgi:hypothetical protein
MESLSLRSQLKDEPEQDGYQQGAALWLYFFQLDTDLDQERGRRLNDVE